MAEITQDITLGEAFDFARNRALTLEQSSEAGSILTLKNAVSAGKLGDNITLDSPYLSTLNSEEFATQISKRGKTATNYYVNAQALEKYVNQGFITQGLPTTSVIGATGTAKASGIATGQTRGTLPMRGMIPYDQIDRIYAEGFAEMGDEVSEATKDFLIYHRYTNHRVSTILEDKFEDVLVDGKEQKRLKYKSLRLSDISVFKDKEGNTVVTIAEAIRDKKKRFATTYTGSFAEFLKGVVEKAKSANPNMPNDEIKLFGTSESKVNKAWKKHLLPKFVDRFESFLPIHTSGKDKGKVVKGLTQIVRSANIEALESDLKLKGPIGDDYMGHTPTGTKMKSYRVNTPESKAIGNVTENMVKTSSFNLGANTVNDLFTTKYGLKASNLDISNQGVKVYDGHKSDFKFSEDALKEVPTSRVPTKEEVEAYRQKAITETKTQQLAQKKLDIDIGKAEIEKLSVDQQVGKLTAEQKVKKAEEAIEQQNITKEVKQKQKLLDKSNAWQNLSEETVKTLKEQGLWDDIVSGGKKAAKVATTVAGAIVSKIAKSAPGPLGGYFEYLDAKEKGDSEQIARSKGAIGTLSPIGPSDITAAEDVVGFAAEPLVKQAKKSMQDQDVGFLEGLTGGLTGVPIGGFSSGGFIDKNQSRR